mmetsp:Transcript_15979/g.31247  ORF Transcript_15979/g.31247 Transcript_15979/m.31247 type:complete len:124 (+) Transcript_15979:320-691(+)
MCVCVCVCECVCCVLCAVCCVSSTFTRIPVSYPLHSSPPPLHHFFLFVLKWKKKKKKQQGATDRENERAGFDGLFELSSKNTSSARELHMWDGSFVFIRLAKEENREREREGNQLSDPHLISD